MSEEIIKVLDALAEKFGLAVDWTSSNVIPYIKQLCGKYVHYEIATSVVWLLVGIGCLILGRILFKKMKYCYEKSDGLDKNNVYSRGCEFAAVFCVSFIIAGGMLILIQLLDIVTCFTFPEKIIFYELKSIYSSMN